MANRHRDAVQIDRGVSNPAIVIQALAEACRELRVSPGHRGTAQICTDPAVQLMVHQLACLCGLRCDWIAEDGYRTAVRLCEGVT